MTKSRQVWLSSGMRTLWPVERYLRSKNTLPTLEVVGGTGGWKGGRVLHLIGGRLLSEVPLRVFDSEYSRNQFEAHQSLSRSLHSLSLSLTISLSHTLTHSPSRSLSLSLTLTHAHTDSLSHTHALTLTHTQTHSDSLSLTHTDSHSLTRSLSHTHLLSLSHAH